MAIEDREIPLLVTATIEEVGRFLARKGRRMYLYGQILSADDDEVSLINSSLVSNIIDDIMYFNRVDLGLLPEERDPIIMYINSPGGDVTEGLALISAMELSKTPICTVNVGEWSSMAFLIGIAGKKRFSMPNMTFLLYDGFGIAGGSVSKLHDRIDSTSVLMRY